MARQDARCSRGAQDERQTRAENQLARRKAALSNAKPSKRADYKHFTSITTRWMDNDVYGHVNNVIYYSFFDTAVNEIQVRKGLLDIENSPVIAFVVETGCRYFSSL